jgi:hypothetical protein
VIRNAVIHITNEQPLVADLFELPAPADVGLRCTNLRTLSGKRPVFADHLESIFFFPYHHIRFVEIPPGADEGGDLPAIAPGAKAPAAPEGPAAEPEVELEIDEDFLRRIREV